MTEDPLQVRSVGLWRLRRSGFLLPAPCVAAAITISQERLPGKQAEKPGDGGTVGDPPSSAPIHNERVPDDD